MKLGLVREDFSFQASKTLSLLFDQPDFSDVTLVCEDQKQILAHKVILASGSSFFKNILSLNLHPKPLIYLKVKFSFLQAIMRFVYTGQCKVAQEELETFLELAKSLEIAGLQNDEESTAPVKTDWGLQVQNGETQDDDQETVDTSHLDGDGQSKVFKKEEPQTKSGGAADPLCKDCELRFPSENHLEEHMMKEHLHICNVCNKTFPFSKTLTSHKRIHNMKREGEDPDLHFPQTEEEMLFFGGGERGRVAYDKHYFSFRY